MDLVAELVAEGFMDAETHEIIDGTSPGYPRRLSDPDLHIAHNRRFNKLQPVPTKPKRPRTIPCPTCGKKFNSPDARDWHRKDKAH